LARPIFLESPAAHALGNQGAFVFGHGPPDLEQELVMGVLAHGVLDELDDTAAAFQFLQQEDLMDIFTGEAVGRSDEHAVKARLGDLIAQAIQARALERGATVAVIAKDLVRGTGPLHGLELGLQARQLLVDGLGLGLALAGDPGI
jgi:hypothetical protein